MPHFQIQIHCFQDVLDFVRLATEQPYRIRLSNHWQSANATSFMALASMDHCQPLQVSADCTEEEIADFRQQIQRLVIE